ncbi:hypothetical protein UFOVP577_51 [uncultured Caudovirales phage]|jgi:hypothetical protein|uniref:Uncharacterized protein n=1 Tax=uncultured Caudovirales phage TaxID=2100421 RepID=A0A6J5MY53_9CAUD|nr:hypothetical protein UFOVP577_51 [uncultured Caudovirales phage]
MSQNSVLQYAKAIQQQLSVIVDVPVYANFNRNYATQESFLTWQLRNVHQPVYTGQIQGNKGIDTPTFQISVFSQQMGTAFTISQTILDELHGYSGVFGTTDSFVLAKADVVWLYNTYDNELGLNQIILDCTLYISTPT